MSEFIARLTVITLYFGGGYLIFSHTAPGVGIFLMIVALPFCME